MIKRPLLFSLFIFLCPYFALAQTASDNSLLPEINPQDIEIRSEFKARFPGLRRQPILGFNPKPRVFQIQADRMPFMESREDAVANILSLASFFVNSVERINESLVTKHIKNKQAL